MGRGSASGGRSSKSGGRKAGTAGSGVPIISKNRDGSLNPDIYTAEGDTVYKRDADGRLLLPKTFKFEKGVDVSAARLTPKKAIEIVNSGGGKWLSPDVVVTRAAQLVLLDHDIRRNGKPMQSRYAGKDAITGKSFGVGTRIIYLSGSGTIINE